MLPRWHILWGGVFTLIIWLSVPNISYPYLLLIFLSSFLIDFDHYITGTLKTKSINPFHSINYYSKKRNLLLKGGQKSNDSSDFHLFHTLEFHLLIGVVGIFFTPFFYIFLGMIFHSILDLIYLLHTNLLFTREYFLFNWTRKNFTSLIHTLK